MPKDWSKYNKWKKSQKEHKHSETPNHKRISAEAPNSALIYHRHADGTVHRHETLLDEDGIPRAHDHQERSESVFGVQDLSAKMYKEMGGQGTIHDMLKKVKTRSNPNETQWRGYVGY
tara:strand:+ start:675 stop:1028 length:354 start_codon:yes stop_codon:yes gene_type:complete